MIIMPNQEISDALVAFPANVKHLMPDEKSLPDKIEKKWYDLATTWFYKGLEEGFVFSTKDGINPEEAFKHLKCIMESFQPEHNYKMKTVAFLLSEWFNDYRIEKSDED